MTPPIDYVIVIPARYASERLPGKMLLDLGGKPLLQHAWECARDSSATDVIVATDDARIEAAAQRFGAHVVMTSERHRSGSDRIAECAQRMSWGREKIIVNLQGDEPLMPTACLDQVAELLQRTPGADVATLFEEAYSSVEVQDPNVVKVVMQDCGQAIYFSRSPVPFARDFDTADQAMAQGVKWRRHIGLYAYRRAALDWFVSTPPTPLEQAEKLEQLRFIESGRSVILARAVTPIPSGVDTSADLERVAREIARREPGAED